MSTHGILEMTARVVGHAPLQDAGSAMYFSTDAAQSEYALMRRGTPGEVRGKGSKRIPFELDTSFGHLDSTCIGKVKVGNHRVMFLLNSTGRKQIKADAIRILLAVDDAERQAAVTALVDLFKDDPQAVLEL